MALAMGSLSGSAKLAAVTDLMSKLRDDLTLRNLLPQQRNEALEELKIYGRDPRNSEPIYTKDGIETLTRHALDSSSDTTSRNALRCLCNAMLLKPETGQMFVNLGYEPKACEKLKNDNRDDEFLISRILFLLTYGAKADMRQLIDEHNLAETVVRNLERHSQNRISGQPVTEPMEEMALAETLKLLFNITHFCKDRASSFTQAIPPIVALLTKTRFKTTKALDPPIMFMVNALLNLELNSKAVQPAMYPQAQPNILSETLIELLAKSRTQYTDEELESSVTPLVGVIRAVYEYAPAEVKTSMQAHLLPTDWDRTEVLGRSGSLPSWLLRNTTNALAPHLREAISELLFDLSDRDPSKFVENVGYGFASGFLMNKNIEVPPSATEAYSNDGSARPRNPVTGQFLDEEAQPAGPEMTDEEKEREAEKLFVLFERLRANGVISAENPVRVAQQQGRFEELPDDHDEDVD